MQQLPHLYNVQASANPTENLNIQVNGLEPLTVAAPAQFGGPGDLWSPEDLLMASLTSCLELSFRAIAPASKLEWISLDCSSEGTLDRIDGVTRFTSVTTTAKLVIPVAESPEKAEKLLMKAEQTCLISNSLNVSPHLVCDIVSR